MQRTRRLSGAGLAVLLLAPALGAQSNATADLMTYGDVIGDPFTAELRGLTPNSPVFLVPSLTCSGSDFLANQTGDPDDFLTVDIDLAAGGTYFQGTSDSAGAWSVTLPLQAPPSLLGATVCWQGFTQVVPGGGVDEYQDFTNLRVMSLNEADRWQGMVNDQPAESALTAWVITETGLNGRATELFACGGGPALVTEPATPYHAAPSAWYVHAADETHTQVADMSIGRAFHTATLLQDGRVLVVGGVTYGGMVGSDHVTDVLDTAEIYDPATNTWTPTAPMSKHRAGHYAVPLPDGRVFVAGGTEGNGSHQLTDVFDLLGTSLQGSEIYDPATNSWAGGPQLPEPTAGGFCAEMLDGRYAMGGGVTHVIILGIPFPDFSSLGYVFDPATVSFPSTFSLKDKRALTSATTLDDGRVLMAGGAGGDIFNIGPIADTETYDPATNGTTDQGNLSAKVGFSAAVTMPDGRALIVGGAGGTLDDPIPVDKTFWFDPSSGTWSDGATLTVTRGGGVVQLMEDGTVYAGGGESDSGESVKTTESYSP